MMSYIQYRRIGKSVVKTKSRGVPDPEKGRRATGTGPSTVESSHTEDARTQDTSIWVVGTTDVDPIDPRNWPLASRCRNIAVLSLLVFTQAWAGAAESMANAQASQEFNISKVTENLSTALYLFGIGSGSLLGGPLSETVGRNPAFLATFFVFLFFVFGFVLASCVAGF